MALNYKKSQKLSMFMSKILRHDPLSFGIVLDSNGYCTLDELLHSIKVQSHWKEVKLEDLYEVVENCTKQRYEIKENKVRARYGHSFSNVKYEKKTPPKILYHGTYEKVVDKICNEGIKKMERKYVHLSASTHFASLAGSRRGNLVMLEINAEKANEDGISFYYAGNEVWLSDFISPDYIKIL